MGSDRIFRKIHEWLNTRKWRHYLEHGHWPYIRYEDELLGHSGPVGFAACVRCWRDE